MVELLRGSASKSRSETPTDAPLRGRRVCCVVQTGTPARNARLIKVAEAASAAGADTTILYVSHSGDCAEPQGPFEVRQVATRPPSQHRVWLLRVVTNLWRELVINPRLVTSAAARERADVYHAHFLPMLRPAHRAARRNRAALVYDVRDLFLDAGYSSVPLWRQRYLGRIERRLIHKAQAVLAVGRPMADVLEERYGLTNVQVLLNGPYRCSSEATPISSPVRLLFQGAFRRNRNLTNLVRAMDSLRGDAELTLQGWGDQEGELRALVDSLGLQGTVHFREPCEPRDVVTCAQEYDVGVICYRADTLNLKISTPNKLFDYIGAGLAVAASDLPGLRSVVGPTGCGVLIDPTSAETLAAGLREIVSDSTRLLSMKQASVDACDSLSWDRQAEKLVAIYAESLRG